MNTKHPMEKSLQKIQKESKKLKRSLKKAQKQAAEHLPQWNELEFTELPQRKSFWIVSAALGLFITGLGLSIWMTQNTRGETHDNEGAQNRQSASESETQEEELDREDNSWLNSAQNFVKHLQKSVHHYLQQISRK